MAAMVFVFSCTPDTSDISNIMETSTIHVHVGKYTIIRPMDPSWFSWNFGRWWTTCWTRPRIVLRSMPLMTLTRQPCIMQPGGHCFGKVDGWKVDTGGTFFFFGWQFWERKTWSHTSQIYDKHDGYSWWFQTFFCFPQFFTFTSCLGTRHEILNLAKYFSTGLKSLPSVISRISRLMSRAKLFLCWVAPAHLQEEHFAYIEGHPIIQLSDQLKLILAVQFIPGWWKNSRVFITSQVM